MQRIIFSNILHLTRYGYFRNVAEIRAEQTNVSCWINFAQEVRETLEGEGNSHQDAEELRAPS